MRIAGVVRDSIVDGVGIRDVIFTQGCPHHCKGCHNPNTWNGEGGYEIRPQELEELLCNSSNGITISGGEPLEQFDELTLMIYGFAKQQNKSVWLYTGYEFEQVEPYIWRMLANCGLEVVVDGQFHEDKKDPNLLFRGSSNQRLIDLPRSVRENKIILWEENR